MMKKKKRKHIFFEFVEGINRSKKKRKFLLELLKRGIDMCSEIRKG